MSLAQYASPYNNDSETDNINNQNKQNQNLFKGNRSGSGSGSENNGGKRTNSNSTSLRKTIKRPPQQMQPQSRVANFMNKLNENKVNTTSYIQEEYNGYQNGNEEMDESDLADYNPTETTTTTSSSSSSSSSHQKNETNQTQKHDDDMVTRENFEILPSSYAKQYYQQYIPYHNQSQSSDSIDTPKDELLQKMNHIIQMLEDQQDEKTGSVTEELILYCFLGVFVIFVVDSFVRAGKYVR